MFSKRNSNKKNNILNPVLLAMEASIAPENLRSKWDVHRRTSFITSTSVDAPRLEFYVKKGINLASRDNYGEFLQI